MTKKVTVKRFKLEDMSREELLLLVQRRLFDINELHMIEARHRVTSGKAKALSVEAQAEQLAIVDITTDEGYKAWKAANRKFAKADRLYDLSSAYHDLYVQVEKELRGG